MTHERPTPATIYHVAQHSIREFGIPSRRGVGSWLTLFVEANAPLAWGTFAVKNSKLDPFNRRCHQRDHECGRGVGCDLRAVPYAKRRQ